VSDAWAQHTFVGQEEDPEDTIHYANQKQDSGGTGGCRNTTSVYSFVILDGFVEAVFGTTDTPTIRDQNSASGSFKGPVFFCSSRMGQSAVGMCCDMGRLVSLTFSS
jgi:hypothetical protein